jgi:NAD(P)-dependent dehydrogenase (short-subunit alcohol dehydrogenase family)
MIPDGVRVAVVTGANRGLGLEVARQLRQRGYEVVLCARREADAARAAAPLHAVPAALDVTSTAQAEALAELVRARFGRVDALVNNAGTMDPAADRSPLEADPYAVLRELDANTVGAVRVSKALALLLSRGANVVNVSSGMGGIAEMNGGSLGYRLSKAALNAFTRVLHAELAPRGIHVNSVCPGWVRTDMGGARAPRSVEEGAAGIVWAATLGPDGPSGGFFRDGKPIAW